MNRSSCCTKADKLARILELTGMPFRARCPLTWRLGDKRNMSVFRSVVFPAPLDPMTTSSSPGRAKPLTVTANKLLQ
jgi:hypothetical protein